MPGTVVDDIETMHSDRGSTPPPPSGGEDDDSGGRGPHPVPQRAYFTGVSLGLAAILMFFMALTSSYIVRKGLGGDWQSVELPRIVWLNTLVLVASSVTIEFARKKRAARLFAAFRQWWGITTALGALFLVGQILAWRQLAATGVYLKTNPASSFFYVLTAAHGLHLAGGVIALLYVTFRTWQHSRITQVTAAELTSIYWHFMDGLWVFLFILLYLGR